MKKFIALMIAVLVFAYVSLFFIKKPDGTPIKTLDTALPSFDFSGAKEMAGKLSDAAAGIQAAVADGAQTTAGPAQPQARQYYRWTDADGRLKYGDNPPPGVTTELVTSGPVDTISSRQVPVQDNVAANEQSASPQGRLQMLENVQQTLDQARNVEEQLQQRAEEQEKAIRNL